jgi:hypothetical protein
MAAALWLFLIPALVLSGPRFPAERVQLNVATLHAATLTTSRAAGDTTDAPFLLVNIMGPRAASRTMAPEGEVPHIRQDGAIGARPLTELSMESGDSVQVLVSVLENPKSGLSGAQWLGSASLLLTNEGGSIFWRRLDCVASCKVLTAPAATALPSAGQPSAGVLEFTGSGGVYHLALRANRAQ